MRYAVKLDGSYSDLFEAFLGLVTGDPTAPGKWNLAIADYKVPEHIADICLNGKLVPKMEHADDIAIATTEPQALQEKLDATEKYMGDIGCEMQVTKCVYSIHNRVLAKSTRVFYAGNKVIHETLDFKYVGVYFSTNAQEMFRAHYSEIATKASRMANMCLGVERMVRNLSVWDSRCLYMARVDSYLTNGSDISLDVMEAQIERLEKIQKDYLRRMLGLNTRCPIVVLYSETGIQPIRYRRILAALKYLEYMVSLPPERLVYNAIMDSYALACEGKISWINDMRIALAKLPIAVRWDINEDTELNNKTVKRLQKKVHESLNQWITESINQSSRVRDILRNRKERENGKLVYKALAFRHYLRVEIPKHRLAITRAVLSSHALAMERMRWKERHRTDAIPQEWRLCRFCKVYQEDVIHALLVCAHEAVTQIRGEFLNEIYIHIPEMRTKHSDPGEMFRDMLSIRSITAQLAKYVYEVLEIFYAEPMLNINPQMLKEVEDSDIEYEPEE
ncbi:hypothetical protein B0H34DRAFT_656575 [Crassisporium funariophilum]|nr:hypothetical protein B0H34DRAFT_656575 [Crassisporium funariophilum]